MIKRSETLRLTGDNQIVCASFVRRLIRAGGGWVSKLSFRGGGTTRELKMRGGETWKGEAGNK